LNQDSLILKSWIKAEAISTSVSRQECKSISGIHLTAVPTTASSVPASEKAVNGKNKPTKPLNIYC